VIKRRGIIRMTVAICNLLFQLSGACAAEHRSYHITGGIPVE
jgi:hypothetical protein